MNVPKLRPLQPSTLGRRRFLLILAFGALVGLLSTSALALNPASGTTTTNQQLTVDLTLSTTDNPVWLGTPVSADATATLGEGETAAIVYVVDVSGSMENTSVNPLQPAVGDCDGDTIVGSALDAECVGLIALNTSLGDAENVYVGLVAFANGAVTANVDPVGGGQDFTTPPDEDAGGAAGSDMNEVIGSLSTDFGTQFAGVGQFTNQIAAGFAGATNYNAALTNMNTAFAGQGADTNTAFFLSDGEPTTFTTGAGSPLQAAIDAGTVINTFRIGGGAAGTCAVGQPLRTIADSTGGSCTEVADPSTLNTVLPALLTNIVSLEIKVNGGLIDSVVGSEPLSMSLPNVDITGALVVGINTIEAVATAADGTVVTADATLGVVDLTLSPLVETNELGTDNSHTVTATVLGDPTQVAGILIAFVVGGQNAGATGVCVPASCTTDAAGQVTFTYTVPVAPPSLGTDTITATATIPAGTDTATVTKDWVDTTPPEGQCQESVNPNGKNTPPAGSTTLPGAKGGQNEDGFYEISGVDDVFGAAGLVIFVTDTGSGTVFGPYPVGTVIKYTQDADATPEAKAIGSANGQAGAVTVHIIGNGDATVTAVDGSGNVSDPVSCLVPPPPK